MMLRKAALLALLLLPACREDEAAAPPPPVSLTAEAVGYFCQMNVLDHPGPKGQIFLKDVMQPLFFGQVSDAVAFLRMPEQAGEVVAVYVSDMGAAPDWQRPGADNWVAADAAVFVTGSARMGGMGLPEAVPFADPDRARAFAAEHGGQVVALDAIPRLAAPEAEAGEGSDYADRLRAVSQ